MRWIVGGKAVVGSAASPSQIGRFETQWLATDKKNLSALADLSGQWIDLVHGRRPQRRRLQRRRLQRRRLPQRRPLLRGPLLLL
jgi:hypothetical protein